MVDIIVVGAGHAGVEAALAPARMGLKVILITGNLDKIASMPCNPSIGGPAKGIVVREIDALGGQMGKTSDLCQIQMKMLNRSKGPAVWALRAQSDKYHYPKEMRRVIENEPNIDLVCGLVETLIVEDGILKGVKLDNGKEYHSKKVILTTGTYLNSVILRGHNVTVSGPDNQPTTFGLSRQLAELGFDVVRLKTGTPPRIKTPTIDFTKAQEEPGDSEPLYFSFDEHVKNIAGHEVPCYLIYTNQEIHDLINANLLKSARFGGVVKGVGPRYCPSIEDKVVRFSDKSRHQIFLEPESLEYDETYIGGFSTSMPEDVQDKMIHLLPGLENCEVIRYAYAIEYDAINPLQLWPSLETKVIPNLYCAGQINGTSGYEEAACQGLMAGINASLAIQNKAPLILRRDEAYIGVLIDDLVTKGVEDPYRLLTSRAEYRLLLRHDNADLRLREYGYQIGLINEERHNKFLKKKSDIESTINHYKETIVYPTKQINQFLVENGSTELTNKVSLFELIKRPEINYQIIKKLDDFDVSDEVLEEVEISIKYEGYIIKSQKEADKLKSLEEKKIPSDIDYNKVVNLALEAKEKLMRVNPLTIGQASRISGVNPSDIQVLLIYLESGYYEK